MDEHPNVEGGARLRKVAGPVRRSSRSVRYYKRTKGSNSKRPVIVCDRREVVGQRQERRREGRK